jgi:hypothetical protein
VIGIRIQKDTESPPRSLRDFTKKNLKNTKGARVDLGAFGASLVFFSVSAGGYARQTRIWW